jgi:hypothetical protein
LGGRIEAGKDRRKVSRSVEIMGSISIGCTADADREWGWLSISSFLSPHDWAVVESMGLEEVAGSAKVGGNPSSVESDSNDEDEELFLLVLRLSREDDNEDDDDAGDNP